MKITHDLLREPDSGTPPAGGGTPPPAPAFTPSFDGAVGADGSFSPGWTAKAFGTDYNGPLAQAKTLSDAEKMLRDNIAAARAKTDGMIRVPGADAKPEDWQAYHKAIGVPEAADGYGLAKPDTLPDGVVWDDGHVAAFSQVAHKLGLTPAQVKGLTEFQTGFVGDTVKAQNEGLQTALANEKADLAKRFGDNIGNAVNAATQLANAKGAPESLKAVVAAGAFDPQSPKFWGADALEFAAFAAKAMGEDRGGGGVGGAQAMSVAEVKIIMSDKSHPLHSKWASGDAELNKRIQDAYKAES
jgi:hypothetical protein